MDDHVDAGDRHDLLEPRPDQMAERTTKAGVLDSASIGTNEVVDLDRTDGGTGRHETDSRDLRSAGAMSLDPQLAWRRFHHLVARSPGP
jgi:hypothetical protein